MLACFQVMTEVFMKSYISWDLTPCSLLKLKTDVSEHVVSIFRTKE
jgi:hypothetical protein